MRLANHAEPLLEATRLAWQWHGHQTRKGKPTTSYMSHLFQVAGLVIEHGGDEEQVIAAFLHDALEDADTPAERGEREKLIAETFGSAPLSIILACTDTTRDEAGEAKGPWRERKLRLLEQLAQAPARSLLVAACDKRHNLGDLVSDLHHEGPETFSRFSAGAKEQAWYFGALGELFRKPERALPQRLRREFDDLLTEFIALIR